MRAVEWTGGSLRILDQTRLPGEEVVIEAFGVQDVATAIHRLAIRGAPLLGLAAAYGMALAVLRSAAPGATEILDDLERAGAVLMGSRPTAANIGWAVRRTLGAAQAAAQTGGADAIRQVVVEEAHRIALEDEASCEAIARHGAELLPGSGNVLTHCNTGALATGGSGTAQGMIVAASRSGKRLHVWVDETRPVLQGSRLTAWELQRAGVPMTLVADTAAGSLMARGLVDVVVVGADRIVANGDVANKVGTYQLAVLADHHHIPFFVAAPFSTVDFSVLSGADIVIEERDPAEVLSPGGLAIAPAGTQVANPAFDVTPAGLITAIVTDRGVARPPLSASLGSLDKMLGPPPERPNLQGVPR
jgi:methylthioribose-1-phosphate isomerase